MLSAEAKLRRITLTEVWIINNYWMRLSIISRIIQTEVNVICRSEAEADNIDPGLNNSWCHAKAESNNCFMGVCKSRNPTRNTRNLPGTPGTPPGTPGTLPGTPRTLPGTPGNPPGTPGTPHGTRWNTSYEATHMFLYKFTCFALISGWWMVTIITFYLYCCFFK
jgi:hypothetical protein